MDEEQFIPDGSGVVTINICDWKGNIKKVIYKNLSEINTLNFGTGENDKQEVK